jgi:F420H(2)-dependent quinone reductase
MTTDTDDQTRRLFLPPRWFIRGAWLAHRALLRASRGRRGLWPPKGDGWGTLLLVSTGRRSGKPREAILGYIEDGPNLVTLAMNGWGAPEPAWWLNLQAHPDATITLKDRRATIRARVATGDERARLWARWQGRSNTTERYAARRPGETAVVVLEPLGAQD